MKILFFNTPSALKNRTLLKRFIVKQFRKSEVRREGLNVIFCTDQELLKINRDFLQHDYYTDIITFDYGENQVSELYVSRDRVLENARNEAVSYSSELLRVIFHGSLHILGFGDKTKEEVKIMRQMEIEFLDEFGHYVSRGTGRINH